MKPIKLFEQFINESVVTEAVSRATKIYQIATPAPKSMLVRELEDLFGDDYRHIVTEFDDDEGYESVLVFNLTKNDIKRIQEKIGDVLIWEYSIKKGKEIMESVVTESKFKVGDKWEWNTSDGIKVVSITNVKSNGDVVGRENGSSEDFIVRDANKYLKKKVTESVINEAKTLTRDELIKILKDKYSLHFTKTSEEFDGEEGGIWLGSAEGKVMPDGKTEMFNYYHGGSKFPNGINKSFASFLDKNGWYGQFADPGTVLLWPK